MFTGIFACLFIINVSTYYGLCMWIKLNETGLVPVEKLINHEKYSWMNTFYPAITLAATTVVVIFCIVDFRYTLQRAYFAFYMRQELEKGSSYLKMRTIEIECSLLLTAALEGPLQLNPQRLEDFLNRLGFKFSNASIVTCCAIIPDLSELLGLESQRVALQSGREFFKQKKPTIRFMMPKNFKDEARYQKELAELDYQIDQLICKKMQASRTAFISLSSFEAIRELTARLE